MDPHALRATLSCPVCHCPLRAPTTLTCGHTVCAHHPTVPCPLPQCAPPTGPVRPRIPPTSRVNYHPPPPPPPAPLQPAPVEAPKLDVTINKIIALLDSGRPLKRQRLHESDDDSDDRPRKRQRLDESADDSDDNVLPATRSARRAAESREGAPDGVTFCAKCLHRAFDHSNLCPLCRDNLPTFSFFENHPRNQTLETLLVTAFPSEYLARGDAIAAEERDARLDTPIFVCMLVFPGHPTPLHFFEPRYRLMLRRCLEQDVPSFGMIMSARQDASAGVAAQTDYGTMLEVRSVQMLADGRSMVETWSTYRFRIIERGTFDGYTVGRIERIDDIPDLPALALAGPSNEQLMETCTNFLEQLRRGTAPWVLQRLNNVYGAAPTDPAAFAYWVALVLPIDDIEKAKLLPIRSAHLRLRLAVHWIKQLNNNWWFTSGCVIS
ncbi:PUA-like domain-containing protein [Mycena leptocephala]|nr:PUA-like domain-containing protein [Mycena leptocephala]